MKNDNECFGGMGCPGIYRVAPKEKCGAVFGCPGVYELISEEDCLLGSCPGIYEGIENDYLIIGSLVERPKDFGLEKKVGRGEVLIRIPKKIIDDIKR